MFSSQHNLHILLHQHKPFTNKQNKSTKQNQKKPVKQNKQTKKPLKKQRPLPLSPPPQKKPLNLQTHIHTHRPSCNYWVAVPNILLLCVCAQMYVCIEINNSQHLKRSIRFPSLLSRDDKYKHRHEKQIQTTYIGHKEPLWTILIVICGMKIFFFLIKRVMIMWSKDQTLEDLMSTC